MLDFLDPRVDRYIVLRGGEQKVLEVPKHWASLLWPTVRMLTGCALCTWSIWLSGFAYWAVLYLGWVLVVEACWRHLKVYRDRFVITTVRIFRFTGVVRTRRATIPIGRITDMTVSQPTLGHLLNYGHLRFESAGQRQDLENVKYVRDVDRVEEIQRIVSMKPSLEKAYEAWTSDDIARVLEGT
jgi:membrane protein YdbS with pleckstrin-like domain